MKNLKHFVIFVAMIFNITLYGANKNFEKDLRNLFNEIEKLGYSIDLPIKGGYQTQEKLEKEFKNLLIVAIFVEKESLSKEEIAEIIAVKIEGTWDDLFDKKTGNPATALNLKKDDKDPGLIRVSFKRWGETPLNERSEIVKHEYRGLKNIDRSYEVTSQASIRDFFSAHTNTLFKKSVHLSDMIYQVCYLPVLKGIVLSTAYNWKNCGAKQLPSTATMNKYLDRLVEKVPSEMSVHQGYLFEITLKQYPKHNKLDSFLNSLKEELNPKEYGCKKTYSPQEIKKLISVRIQNRDDASPYCDWGSREE